MIHRAFDSFFQSIKITRIRGLGLLFVLTSLLSAGCIERNANVSQSSDANTEQTLAETDQVDRSELFQLARRLGLRGAEPVVTPTSRQTRPSNQSFVNMGSNGSRPRSGNLSYPIGRSGNSTLGRQWPLGRGNATFGPGANGTFPGGNGTFPGAGANRTFPGSGGNATFSNPRFVPLRGAGSRGLPLAPAGNSTLGGR